MQWDHSTSRAGHEIKAIALGFAVVSAYMLFVLVHPKVSASEFEKLFGVYFSRIFSAWLTMVLFATLLHLLSTWKRDGNASPVLDVVAGYYRVRWQRDFMLSFFWPPLLFAMLMASFNTFKQLILPEAGFRFDPLFADLDRALFLGHDPWRITHGLLPSPWVT